MIASPARDLPGAAPLAPSTQVWPVFLLLVVLFVGLPIAEIALLIEVGGVIGLLPTLAACIATAVVGAWLAKAQGASVLRQVQRRLWQGEVPARELVDGLLVAVAGVALLTPGFVTDALGLLILFPPTRLIVRAYALRQLQMRVAGARPTWVTGDPWGGTSGTGGRWEGSTGQGGRWGGPGQPDRQEQPVIQLLPPKVAPRPEVTPDATADDSPPPRREG